MLYYKIGMGFLKFITGGRKRRAKKIFIDFYQESIEKQGRDQIKKLADKGMNIPVIML